MRNRLNARKPDCAIVPGCNTWLQFFLFIWDRRARSWETIHPRLQKRRHNRWLLRPTRSIGSARNADVIIASATLPVTLIWIKHREIGAQVGCTWCSLQMEKADEICHKGCPCSFVLRVCGNALPRLVWTRRHLTVSRERPGTGRPPADARERCGCRAPTYAAGCVRRRDHRCRRDRHGRRDRCRTLLWWSGLLFRWSLRGLRLPVQDYATRNGFVCRPGTMVRLDDGLQYPCQ